MINLKLIENQPRWRVAIVARFARLMGVLVHVEGIPFGSNRIFKKSRQAKGEVGPQTARALGSFQNERAVIMKPRKPNDSSAEK